MGARAAVLDAVAVSSPLRPAAQRRWFSPLEPVKRGAAAGHRPGLATSPGFKTLSFVKYRRHEKSLDTRVTERGEIPNAARIELAAPALGRARQLVLDRSLRGCTRTRLSRSDVASACSGPGTAAPRFSWTGTNKAEAARLPL